MLVSVIIPSFNVEARLVRAVSSLLDTGYKSLEVLIVDDGSTDGTLSVAEKLSLLNPSTVRVLSHPNRTNQGVSASRNLGIREARGDLLCFLDADDFVYPCRFSSCVPLLRENPDIDGVYELTQVIQEVGSNAQGLIVHPGSDYFGLTDQLTGEELLARLLQGYPWHPGGFTFRRSLLDCSGVFHERLRIAEDCHLWFRMAAIGRIVPGDFACPVSAYVRHNANTYRYSLDRKLDMLRAMFDAMRWVKRMAPPSVFVRFRQGVSDYFINALIQAREAERPALGWSLFALAVKERAGLLLFDSRVTRQLYALARESLVQSS